MGFLDKQELVWFAIPAYLHRTLQLDLAVALSGLRGESHHIFGIEQQFTLDS